MRDDKGQEGHMSTLGEVNLSPVNENGDMVHPTKGGGRRNIFSVSLPLRLSTP